MIDENLAVPFEATALGIPVTVERVDPSRDERIGAVRGRGAGTRAERKEVGAERNEARSPSGGCRAPSWGSGMRAPPRRSARTDPLEQEIEDALRPGHFIEYDAGWSFVEGLDRVDEKLAMLVGSAPVHRPPRPTPGRRVPAVAKRATPAR